MKQYALFLVLVLGFAQSLLAFDHTYPHYAKLLQQHVQLRREGLRSVVDYQSIRIQPEAMDAAVAAVEAVSAAEFETWSREQQLAFLINTYNLMVIKLITPEINEIDSIKDIGGMFTNPFRIEFIQLFGEKRSLDYLEHELIRPRYQEPLIHGALVCAAVSCPPLRNEPYVAERLQAQMQENMSKFLNDPGKNLYVPREKLLKLSQIFSWYAKDFEAKGGVKSFVAPYMTPHRMIQEEILRKEVLVGYFDYNWELNLAK